MSNVPNIMISSSKIYVAGHLGLVGSAITRNLESKGYRNLISRSIDELDLRDFHAVLAFFEQECPEYVFLAAAKVGGIVANNTYRGEFLYDNLMIQNNVIEASRQTGVKKLLFLGSTCIYPRDCPQPMREEYLLTSPLEYTNEPYAIAKIAGLKLCESYNLQYGTNFISVMPTNLYGPFDNFDLEKSHVLPALIRKIHLGKALETGCEDAVRRDLDLLPVKGVSGSAPWDVILQTLREFGVYDGSAEPPGGSEGDDAAVSGGGSDAGSGGNSDAGSADDSGGVSGDSSVADSAAGSDGGGPVSRPGVKVEIWGSGRPMREFLWSEDMADACVYVMGKVNFDDLVKMNAPDVSAGDEMSDKVRGEEPGEARTEAHGAVRGEEPSVVRQQVRPEMPPEVRNVHLNIGTGIEISIRELAETVKKVIGFHGQLFFNTDKPDGTMRKLTDPSRIHSLGWRHTIDLKEGIEKLYRWYLERGK